MSKKEQIYIDYLIAKITGDTINSVHKKHNCTRMYVNKVVNEMQPKENLKQQYVTIRDYLKEPLSTEQKFIQTALIRDMYKNKYTVEEIAEFTGKPLNNVIIILFG